MGLSETGGTALRLKRHGNNGERFRTLDMPFSVSFKALRLEVISLQRRSHLFGCPLASETALPMMPPEKSKCKFEQQWKSCNYT